jgi:multidrug efflux pump subunit AcrA (membrane-fusion protein)
MSQNPRERNISFSVLKNCLLFLILILLVFVSGCTKEEVVEKAAPVKPVKIITVQAGAADLRISLPGKVRAARRSELSFKVAGPLLELPIEEGQVIKKGDLVAKISKQQSTKPRPANFKQNSNTVVTKNCIPKNRFQRLTLIAIGQQEMLPVLN